MELVDLEFIEDSDLKDKIVEISHKELTDIGDAHKLELDETTDGLKNKNVELLDEKKQALKKLEKFDTYDFDAANDALDFLKNNENAKLIKDGKVDELIEKETSSLRSDHEAVLLEINGNLDSQTNRGNLYEGLYKTKMVEDALRDAAVAAKIRPEAITDVLLHGRNIFSLSEDGSIEARDSEGKLQKTSDGDKVLTTTNWIEGMKKTSPHYWPGSSGAGANSGGDTGGDDLTAALQRAADSGNMVEFTRLRKKQTA